jgi:hypothetical protein
MRVYTSKIVQCIAAGTLVILSVLVSYSPVIKADTAPLAMLDPNLEVTPVLSTGISQPIGIVFLSLNDYLVLEKGLGPDQACHQWCRPGDASY